MATKQELQEKYADCKFAPKTLDEQKELIQKLHEIGFAGTIRLDEPKCIYTYSNFSITHSEVTSITGLNYFLEHENTLTNIDDLLNETIDQPLTIKDLRLVQIIGENKNVMVFDYLYKYIREYSKDFSTFMQAGEALAAALDVNVLFAVKNSLNPGIGWRKESYNQDINPWVNFLDDSSNCIKDDVIELLENYPLKQRIEIYL